MVDTTFGIGTAPRLLGVLSTTVADLTGRTPASVRDVLQAKRAALEAP